MRRPTFALLACSILLAIGLQAQAPQPQGETVPFAITHGPYLQLPTKTSMTIVWHTNRPAVSRVEFGLADELGRIAVASEHGLIPNDRTSHVIRLDGLTPGRTYKYSVVSREFLGYEKQHIVRYGETARSEISSFTTLDAGTADYSFALVSDIHENAKRLDALLANIPWATTPFVVFDGDMVNDFMNRDQPFTGFIDTAVARFARTIPFVYVRGNHDVRGRYARSLEHYFPARDGHAYYSFDAGPVHFIVLDSGEDKVDAHEYYNGLVAFEPYRAEQARWLAQDLRSAAARRARYRVILSHIPPYGGRPAARAGATAARADEEGFAIQQVRKQWEGAANEGRIDLWLSGHTHRYAHVEPARRANRRQAAPAGTNRYHLVIGAPDTLMTVAVSERQMVVSVTRETGETLDRVVIPSRAR